jgi:hypothetical protein
MNIANVRRRAESGVIAGACVVVCTTGLNLIGRRRGLLSRGMDLREMAPFVDDERHPSGSLAAGIAVHLAAGVAEGGLYGLISRKFSARSGIGFMGVMWLITMRSGADVPIASFVLHAVFGAGLGSVAKSVHRAI